MHGYEGRAPTKTNIPEPIPRGTREEQIEDANKTREEIPNLDQANAEKYAKKYNRG